MATAVPGQQSGAAGIARVWSAPPVLALRMRLKRQRLCLRGRRARRALTPVVDRTGAIRPGMVLVFATIRNEAERLAHFLRHYRALGAGHFLFVDNASDDGSVALLADQPDVSLWQTGASYKAARYGMDWMHALLGLHGHGHWCAVVDADELLVYPHWPTRPLPALAAWLEARGQRALAALMVDLYPDGPLSQAAIAPDADPTEVLCWFDPANTIFAAHPQHGATLALGGPRARAFFAQTPQRIPTQSKVPFLRWDRRNAFVNSTHAILPRRLMDLPARDGGEALSGVLLHTKFLPSIAERSAEEITRRQHFAQPRAYLPYYQALIADPVLRVPASARLEGWQSLEAAGLMGRSDWA